jgi:RNA recognition motif-containing protein
MKTQGTDSPAQKEERLDRTIFVGNIKADIKPKALKQLFAR